MNASQKERCEHGGFLIWKDGHRFRWSIDWTRNEDIGSVTHGAAATIEEAREAAKRAWAEREDARLGDRVIEVERGEGNP